MNRKKRCPVQTRGLQCKTRKERAEVAAQTPRNIEKKGRKHTWRLGEKGDPPKQNCGGDRHPTKKENLTQQNSKGSWVKALKKKDQS